MKNLSSFNSLESNNSTLSQVGKSDKCKFISFGANGRMILWELYDVENCDNIEEIESGIKDSNLRAEMLCEALVQNSGNMSINGNKAVTALQNKKFAVANGEKILIYKVIKS